MRLEIQHRKDDIDYSGYEGGRTMKRHVPRRCSVRGIVPPVPTPPLSQEALNAVGECHIRWYKRPKREVSPEREGAI